MLDRDRQRDVSTFRRPKSDPCADFWHTLRIGVPLAVVLLVILPLIFPLFSR